MTDLEGKALEVMIPKKYMLGVSFEKLKITLQNYY